MSKSEDKVEKVESRFKSYILPAISALVLLLMTIGGTQLEEIKDALGNLFEKHDERMNQEMDDLKSDVYYFRARNDVLQDKYDAVILSKIEHLENSH